MKEVQIQSDLVEEEKADVEAKVGTAEDRNVMEVTKTPQNGDTSNGAAALQVRAGESTLLKQK